MTEVIIRRCPVCTEIGQHSARVADKLRKELGVDLRFVDGAKGEFTVLVDGDEVIGNQGDHLPEVEQVVAAVSNTEAATAGAK